MGKIDFRSLKQKTAEQEVEGTPNEELATAYANVWGKTKEMIEELALSSLSSFTNRKGKKQPFRMNKEKVAQIKASAKDIGIITPLIVRKIEAGYQILSGHHRYQAAKELGLLTVPCVVRNVSDENADRYVIESNIQRVRLLPSEYGAIFERYMEMRKDLEMTVSEIAEKFGVSRKSMYRYANVMKCSSLVQNALDEDRINIDCVDVLCSLSEEEQNTIVEGLGEDVLTISMLKPVKTTEAEVLPISAESQNPMVNEASKTEITLEPIEEKIYEDKAEENEASFDNKTLRTEASSEICEDKEEDTSFDDDEDFAEEPHLISFPEISEDLPYQTTVYNELLMACPIDKKTWTEEKLNTLVLDYLIHYFSKEGKTE